MTKNKKPFKMMIKDKGFRHIFSASFISRFGDAVDTIAFAVMVFQLTGSPALMAVLFAVNGIPSFVLNMFTGVMVAYMPKKKVVYLCDFLRGGVVVLTGILYITQNLEVWHLYLFTILNSTFEAFRAPASASLFVQLISSEKMTHATSLNSSASTFAELVGYASAATIIGFIGISGAIIVDGITFFLSGLIIASIQMKKEVIGEVKLTVKQYKRDFIEGYHYVIKDPLIRSISLFAGCLVFFLVPFNALQAAYVLETLSLNASAIGIMGISFMIAMILGSLITPSVMGKIGARNTFVLGGMVVGTGYFLFGVLSVFQGQAVAYVLLSIVSFIMGSTLSFINIPIQVALMKNVDHSLLTRVISFVNMLALAAVPIGGALVGFLVNYLSITLLFYIFSVIVILLFAAQLFNQSFKALDQEEESLEQIG